MKTEYITIIVTCILCIQVNAQRSKISEAGLKAGYNLSAVSFDGTSETGSRNGFHVGVYGESYLTNVLSLQLELMYSQQGYEIRDDSGTFTQKLNYINLPILLKIYPINPFYIEAGPQIGLAISHKEEFDNGFNLFSTQNEFNPRRFDYGANIGAGIKTNTGVTLGIRYHHGLGDIYDEGQPQNRVWQFSLGFTF